MVKVISPLFGSLTRGKIAGIGTISNRKNGPCLTQISKPIDTKTPRQLAMRARFRNARTAWLAIAHQYRPTWGPFWRAWIMTHPVTIL